MSARVFSVMTVGIFNGRGSGRFQFGRDKGNASHATILAANISISGFPATLPRNRMPCRETFAKIAKLLAGDWHKLQRKDKGCSKSGCSRTRFPDVDAAIAEWTMPTGVLHRSRDLAMIMRGRVLETDA
jgi:hypothetical protein